jgi:GNAT superfamily N-acetyltransferase
MGSPGAREGRADVSDTDWSLSLRVQVLRDPEIACHEYSVVIVGERWLEEQREPSDPFDVGIMRVIRFPPGMHQVDAAATAAADEDRSVGAVWDHQVDSVAGQAGWATGDIWLLDRIELLPEHRGRGLGARALDLFVEAIAREGVMVLTPLNGSVDRYWRTLGFESADEEGTVLYRSLG